MLKAGFSLRAFCRQGAGKVQIVRFLRRLVSFGRAEGGNVLVTFALSITVLLAAAGLGTEVASWYSTRRDMQNAADLGASSAAISLKFNYPGSATFDGYATKEAKAATATHGYADGSNSTNVTVNIPPLSGNYTGASYNHKAAEVIISRPMTALFSSLFLSTGPTITVRAVGLVNTSASDCMVALDPSAQGALYLQGHAQINATCGVAVVSTVNCALDITGGASSVSATSVDVGGNVCGNTSKWTVTPTTNEGGITDPYATRTMPTLASGYPSGGSYPGDKLQTVTFDAAHTYNGDVTSTTDTSTLFPNATDSCALGCVINGNVNLQNATLTLGSGVFFINSQGNASSGSITLGAHGSIVTNGGTIILSSSSGTNVGTFSLQSGQASVTLLSPGINSGDPGYSITQNSTYSGLKGVAIMQDRLATETDANNGCGATNTNTFQGSPSLGVTGAMYFPQGCLQFQGSPTTTACYQLIAGALDLAGDPGINLSGCSQGEALGGPRVAILVE